MKSSPANILYGSAAQKLRNKGKETLRGYDYDLAVSLYSQVIAIKPKNSFEIIIAAVLIPRKVIVIELLLTSIRQ